MPIIKAFLNADNMMRLKKEFRSIPQVKFLIIAVINKVMHIIHRKLYTKQVFC